MPRTLHQLTRWKERLSLCISAREWDGGASGILGRPSWRWSRQSGSDEMDVRYGIHLVPLKSTRKGRFGNIRIAVESLHFISLLSLNQLPTPLLQLCTKFSAVAHSMLFQV